MKDANITINKAQEECLQEVIIFHNEVINEPYQHDLITILDEVVFFNSLTDYNKKMNSDYKSIAELRLDRNTKYEMWYCTDNSLIGYKW